MLPVKRMHFLQLNRFLDFFNNFVFFSERVGLFDQVARMILLCREMRSLSSELNKVTANYIFLMFTISLTVSFCYFFLS